MQYVKKSHKFSFTRFPKPRLKARTPYSHGFPLFNHPVTVSLLSTLVFCNPIFLYTSTFLIRFSGLFRQSYAFSERLKFVVFKFGKLHRKTEIKDETGHPKMKNLKFLEKVIFLLLYTVQENVFLNKWVILFSNEILFNCLLDEK